MICIRCHKDMGNTGSKICNNCMNSWEEMRGLIYDMLVKKYGPMRPENHSVFKKETIRLEKIWRKDKNKFNEVLAILIK